MRINPDDIKMKVVPDEDSPSGGDDAFLGVQAVYRVFNGRCVFEATSGGLWGIEFGSSPEYLKEVFEEEKEELLAVLKELYGEASE